MKLLGEIVKGEDISVVRCNYTGQSSLKKKQVISNGCNMGMGDLPDMYACPKHEGSYIYRLAYANF